MFKLIVASALLVAFVYSGPAGFPTAEEAKTEMLAAGLSQQAVDGILNIASTFSGPDNFTGSDADRQAARDGFNKFVSQVDAYIKTQSAEDQTAYNAFLEKKKAAFQARLAERKQQ